MKVDYISIEQAREIKRRMPKSEIALKYEGYIKDLRTKENLGKVGRIELSPEDKSQPNSVKVRLIRAGKSLGVPVKTKRTGDTILFWEDLIIRKGKESESKTKATKK